MIILTNYPLYIDSIESILNIIKSRGYFTLNFSLFDIINNLSHTSVVSNNDVTLLYKYNNSNLNITRQAFKQLCKIAEAPYSYLKNRNYLDLIIQDLMHDLTHLNKLNETKSILVSNTDLCAINGNSYPRIPNYTILSSINNYLKNSSNLDIENVNVSLLNEDMSIYISKKEGPNPNVSYTIKISNSEAGTGPLCVETFISDKDNNYFKYSVPKKILRKCHIGSMMSALDDLKKEIVAFDTNQYDKIINPKLITMLNQFNTIQLWSSSKEAEDFLNQYFGKHDSSIKTSLNTNISMKSTLADFIGLYKHTIQNGGFLDYIVCEEGQNILSTIINAHI